jgi:hypothetical protein
MNMLNTSSSIIPSHYHLFTREIGLRSHTEGTEAFVHKLALPELQRNAHIGPTPLLPALYVIIERGELIDWSASRRIIM